MSLRNQISLRILLISLCILFIGGSISLWQARKAVSKEVDSSISLALQLIKMSVGTTKIHKTNWMFRLNSLEQTRHLRIRVKNPTGEVVNLTQPQLAKQDTSAPEWFVNLVVSDYPTAEYKVQTLDNNTLILLIQADPLDEISEVWEESLAFLTTLLLLIFLTFLSVHLVFNKTLFVINSIVEHLKGIEKEEYQNQLPHFSTREYDEIAMAINHMTGVLNTAQYQNRSLTQHSLKIQEEERQHLSQELHDEFGQSLTAIKVMAVTAAHKESDTQAITESIGGICDHLMTVVRSMMKQLHPLILTELGLKATLEDMVHHWDVRNEQISFNLYCDDRVDRLDRAVVIQIFRVVQESLTNVIRHAEAKKVNVTLEISAIPSALHILIEDDGKGCDLDQMESGFGLLSMKERIKLLGGKFKIESQVGQGTQTNACIPLSDFPLY